jgi:uncharacterized repeat protein (TIGR01451 family)
MKRSLFTGLTVIAVIVAFPLVKSAPGFAQLHQVAQAIAQQIQRPEVKLVLQAEKQVQTLDEQGRIKLSWQTLTEGATVQPGDTLRYTLASANEGALPAQDLVITQPIAPQMKYVLGSAGGNSEAQKTYSIDNGQTFAQTPMVEVTLPDGTIELQPAPAEAYTHLRWQFETVEIDVAVQVNYQVLVK